MQFWCLIHFKFFVYRHHVPTKIARPECVDNRLAAASYGSTSSELARQSDSRALLGQTPSPRRYSFRGVTARTAGAARAADKVGQA